MFMCDRKTASPVANRAERCGMVWKHVKTGGNKWKRVETTIRMGTVKVGKSCSRTPRKPETGGESAAKHWKKRETTMQMDSLKDAKTCARTRRKTTKALRNSRENPKKTRKKMQNDNRHKS